MRIEHFAIYAADTTALASWYCTHFGLKQIFSNEDSPPTYFLADEHGMAIEIIGRPPREALDLKQVFHFAFLPEDFEAEVARLREAGVPLEQEIGGADGGVRLCYFDDPEGNRGQVVWRKKPLGN
ncbi:MAG: VOC family protein [Planctomycetaceae bacterium]|nr:VOC family protein [Planctomycetaceae bacterium]